MTKKELAKYPSYKKRAEKLKSDIYELETRDIETVSSKVKGSMKEHPYTERRFSVQMEVPEEAEKVHRQIADKEQELKEIERKMQDIEKFVNNIKDIRIKSIFEYRYLKGATCGQTGALLGYTKGRVSQIISDFLKD